MSQPIKISIPTPCHENWDGMTPADKGRFCASCKKTVLDFTNSSDREIASVLKNSKNACGRFRAEQLDRRLIVPKEKSSLWVAASAAVISFLTIGLNESVAQHDKNNKKFTYTKSNRKATINTNTQLHIQGKVVDADSSLIPGANIKIIRSNEVIQSDLNGEFKLTVNEGDKIEISFTGMLTQNISIISNEDLKIVLEQDPQLSSLIEIKSYRTTITCTSGLIVTTKTTTYTEKRTFFGRIFHSIGNLFR